MLEYFTACVFLIQIRLIFIKTINNLNFHKGSLVVNALTTARFPKIKFFFLKNFPNFQGQYLEN